MNFEKVISELKNRQIPLHMLTKAAKGGYICICGNGSGEKGTGATLSKDGTRLLCGKQCGKSNGVYSYIDIAAHYYNIDLTNFAKLKALKLIITTIKIKFPPTPMKKHLLRLKKLTPTL